MTRPFLTTLPPATDAETPNRDELAGLLRIVHAAHPSLVGFDLEEFHFAFWASGRFFRAPAPRPDIYFHSLVSAANDMIEARFNPARQIEGASFLCACLAHADVRWQERDPAVGTLLEVGLNQFTGAKCSNRWRDLLNGRANLLPPTPPRMIDRSVGIVRVGGVSGLR